MYQFKKCIGQIHNMLERGTSTRIAGLCRENGQMIKDIFER